MPETWTTYKLGDLAQIKYGKDHKKLEEGNIPCYGTGGIMRFVNSFLSDEESVLIPRKGSLNSIFYINEPFWTVDTLFWTKVNQELVIPKYLYYYLTTIDFVSKDVGSAIPSLTTSLLNVLDITLPPLPEQKAIANILSAIDDKIENNLSMNKTLEDMAMALYKHWFIDFGPFQEGKFVDSELGKIPEGWEVVKLEQLVEIKYGKDHKKLDKGSIPVYGSGGIMRYVDTFLYDSESVLVPRKGTLSNIFLVNQPFWSVDTMFYTKMRKENILKYTFHLLKTMKLADMDVGSAIPSLTTKLLNFLDVILPDEDVLRKFEIHVTELYEQIWANTEENKTLTQLRDTLLPKLISGKVRLAAFEEEITAAL